MNAERPLAVLGAGGYTGRLVVEQAREAGLPLRLVGRRRDALERLARAGDDVRVADARHEAELLAALDGAFAVSSTVGPFTDVGTRPVGAAIASAAHYLDTSAEQSFARIVYDGFGDSAAERGVVLLTSFGFDYVPGDLAARLAAEDLDEPLDEVVIAYSTTRMATSSGTRRTVGRVMTERLVSWEDRPVPTRFGKTTRRVRFPFGERSVIEWGGTEPLTVPRHTRVHRVRSYVRAPRAFALAARLAPLGAPAVRRFGGIGRSPSPVRRSQTRWTVVAEARSGDRSRRATLMGSDVYGLTALLHVRAIEALRAGDVRGVGALAPAEAFDVHELLARLAPLVESVSVDEL